MEEQERNGEPTPPSLSLKDLKPVAQAPKQKKPHTEGNIDELREAIREALGSQNAAPPAAPAVAQNDDFEEEPPEEYTI